MRGMGLRAPYAEDIKGFSRRPLVLLQRIWKVMAMVAIVSLVSVAAWGQTEKKKEWKDRAEYDLYAAITKEKDPSKKLELLDTWKQKYPTSDYSQERLLFYIQTYKELRQGEKMLGAAQELLKEDPKNIQGLYWITVLTVSLANTAPDRLDMGEKAANGLLANLDETFAPSKRPATTPEEAWKKERANLESVAHTTLGWVAMNRKNNERAEQQFKRSLELNPQNGQVAYWLGTVIAAERIPEKQSAALFYFARAANYTGDGAMPEAGRKQIQAYLDKVYTNYHGDKSGLQELIAMARDRATPPPDLKIKSAAEVAFDKEEALKRANPQLALWMSLKKELEGPDGMTYFTDKLKHAAVPKLKGTLISQSPANRPKELVLGIENPSQPEVTLKLNEPMSHKAEPGTEIEFEGLPEEFTKEPFMLTFLVEKDKIEGWPAPPAAKKRSPRRKK
jgi:tetratricopeptide (TPR) repeat protein